MIECNESLEDVNINQLLYGIHESSNSDVLQELRQVVPLPAENYRQVILLGQRGVIQNYNRLDTIDTKLRIDMDSISKKAELLAHLRTVPPEEWTKQHWDTLRRLEK